MHGVKQVNLLKDILKLEPEQLKKVDFFNTESSQPTLDLFKRFQNTYLDPATQTLDMKRIKSDTLFQEKIISIAKKHFFFRGKKRMTASEKIEKLFGIYTKKLNETKKLPPSNTEQIPESFKNAKNELNFKNFIKKATNNSSLSKLKKITNKMTTTYPEISKTIDKTKQKKTSITSPPRPPKNETIQLDARPEEIEKIQEKSLN